MRHIIHNTHEEWLDNEHRYHREDGPALLFGDNSEYWYIHGAWHRADGPAVMGTDGNSWYLNGQLITSAQTYKKLTGISDEEMSCLILKYGQIDG